jgi:hypothetical protein
VIPKRTTYDLVLCTPAAFETEIVAESSDDDALVELAERWALAFRESGQTHHVAKQLELRSHSQPLFGPTTLNYEISPAATEVLEVFPATIPLIECDDRTLVGALRLAARLMRGDALSLSFVRRLRDGQSLFREVALLAHLQVVVPDLDEQPSLSVVHWARLAVQALSRERRGRLAETPLN